VTPEQADIVYELRDARGIEGVYALQSRGPCATVIVLDEWRPYVLAVATCALLRALPDRDRSHIAVTSSAHFHYAFADLAPITLDQTNEASAKERAASRQALLYTPETIVDKMPDFEPVELLWFQAGGGDVSFAPIVDPFRSLDPSMPIVVRESQPSRDRRLAFHAETVVAALERLTWAKPKWIACDEDLAIGESGLLAALERDHPHLLERTMVIATLASEDFMTRLMARLHPRVRVVTQG
jgi:hypothetical protein